MSAYRLAPHVATLLLHADPPGYVGGLLTVLEQPEVFTRFEANLPSGERMWWQDCSSEWIAGVAGTPFYTRLVSTCLDSVPGLAERLDTGCRVVDTACCAARWRRCAWIRTRPWSSTTLHARVPRHRPRHRPGTRRARAWRLLPAAYDALLTRHGFTDLGSVNIAPVHALTYGRRAVGAGS